MINTYQELSQKINLKFYLPKNLTEEDTSVKPISIDSRTIQPGEWFAAIIGPNFDGHNFIDEAVKAKAAGLITNTFQDKHKNIPQIITQDTTKALGMIAKAWREQFNIPVIGITGSSGKTSTKEMLVNILKLKFNIVSNIGNQNNEYGAPLSLMRLNSQHQIAIIEMGINSPGEMQYLVDIVQPTISLVTNISAAHIGNFQSLEEILNEKWKIYNSNKLQIAILNKDNELISQKESELGQASKLSYSTKNKQVDVSASNISWGHSVAGILMQFTLHTPISDEIIALPLIGEHWVRNATAAATCALSVGAYPEDIKLGLMNTPSIKGRMYPYYLSQDRILIDDTYNASIDSVLFAIDALNNLPGKKLLILSCIEEVGDFAEQIHKQIGTKLLNSKIDKVILTGDTKNLEHIKLEYKNVNIINNKLDLIKELQEDLSGMEYQSILVKGARKYKLEKIIDSALEKSHLMFAST